MLDKTKSFLKGNRHFQKGTIFHNKISEANFFRQNSAPVNIKWPLQSGMLPWQLQRHNGLAHAQVTYIQTFGGTVNI